MEMRKEIEALKEEVKQTMDSKLAEADQAIEYAKSLTSGRDGEDAVTPIKGIHYFDGIDGLPGEKGELGEPGVAGKDGVSPDINEIIREVTFLIPTPKDGKNGTSGKPGKPGKDAVVNYDKILEDLTKHLDEGKLKLKGTHIEGWQDPEELLKRFVARGSLRGGQGSWKYETPSGTIDGNNKTFTLKNAPAPNSLILRLNSVPQETPEDYSIVGSTITMVIAPLVADILRAQYM